ncbi:hypothetical protein H5P28_11735 [Ruficoccus amylovorans]|uniref:Uncharacterized protein n=1 Tax=Ruficoccus amylovorans TaxID=1804625 RepID=A0A842HFW5_9BACT|nr:hypothetical protein [Ruficoccus amylovorans]MBC2594928.1 hypothetical protein [Ruficoccus amylovorans]
MELRSGSERGETALAVSERERLQPTRRFLGVDMGAYPDLSGNRSSLVLLECADGKLVVRDEAYRRDNMPWPRDERDWELDRMQSFFDEYRPVTLALVALGPEGRAQLETHYWQGRFPHGVVHAFVMERTHMDELARDWLSCLSHGFLLLSPEWMAECNRVVRAIHRQEHRFISSRFWALALAVHAACRLVPELRPYFDFNLRPTLRG